MIRCHELGKSFREAHRITHALSSVSFDLPQGEIIGLLGPDGAGKTTLLRLLTGLLRPTAGSARVLGMDTVKEAGRLQSVLGYMPQKFGLYENMTVEENLTLYAELHAVARPDQQKRFAELLDLMSLAPFRRRMAGKLSGGMKQKLALSCALVSNPKLLLLDEPTVGVDVLSRRELWQILRRLVDRGEMSVLASTAYLDEAAYCDRLLILYQGRLVSQTTPDELRNQAAAFTERPTFTDGFQVLLAGRVLPRLRRQNPVRPDAPPVIRAENLVKKFGDFTAVDRVCFEVKKGEIFGLLGANGAGKTTTFRMLCGLSGADEGRVEIAGRDLGRAAAAARRRIGFVAQKFSLYTDLSVRDNLEFFGSAYGLPPEKRRERIDWALDSFDLRSYATSLTAKLPLGFKQRLSMACALLHEPDILFLDEATSGADPMARHEFWARIMELADSGVAVIITTHFLEEAEYCDHMVIMQDGRSAAAGNVGEIRRQGHSAVLEEAFVNIIRDFRREHEPL